jgi:hypothetical protein
LPAKWVTVPWLWLMALLPLLLFVFTLLFFFEFFFFQAFAVSEARQVLDMASRLGFYQISMRRKASRAKAMPLSNTNPRAVKIGCGVRVPPGYGNASWPKILGI